MSPRRRTRGWNPSKLRGPRRRPDGQAPVAHPSPAGPGRLQQLRERGQQQMVAEAVARERARLEQQDHREAHLRQSTQDAPMISEPVWHEHRSGTTTTGG